MIRNHFTRKPDNRAGDLDPATFDYPEQFQPDAPRFDWLRLIVWTGAFAVGVGFWACVAALIF